MKQLLKLILLGTLIINFYYNDAPKPFITTMYDITPPYPPPGGGYQQESIGGEYIEYQINGDKDYQLDIHVNKKIGLQDAIKALQIVSGIREGN